MAQTAGASGSASVECLSALEADVREGRLVSATPRERYLSTLEELERSELLSFEAVAAAAPAERHALQTASNLAVFMRKCRRMNACLACTLNPCICSRVRPLRLAHRLWVISHAKEAMRTTSTGKLLLLSHPRASLLVSGLPQHDARIAEVAARDSAVLMFPAEDALSPAQLLSAVGGGDGCCCCGGGGGGGGGTGSADRTLDIILLDGTWGQARAMARDLPPMRKVAIDPISTRSIFGSLVRKQGEERRQAGRVSTLEAFAQLALALGAAPEQVAALGEHLELFIRALPKKRGEEWEQPEAELPERSRTNPHRRRARHAHSFQNFFFHFAGALAYAGGHGLAGTWRPSSPKSWAARGARGARAAASSWPPSSSSTLRSQV